MRERIDCAVLLEPHDGFWSALDAGEYLGGRLVMHPVGCDVLSADVDEGSYLRDNEVMLRRYDVCIVGVTASNLSWARRLLSARAGAKGETPALAVVSGLKAAAIDDLLSLGLADFIRLPLCYDELRARIQQLLVSRGGLRYGLQPAPSRVALQLNDVVQPLAASGVASSGTSRGFAAPAALPVAGANQPTSASHAPPMLSEDELCDTILQRTGLELDAYAVAAATRTATSKDSFRAAKGRVIERFERAYIAAALGSCSGNIALAARGAQKHRRAFWALMRKYQIDASVYRPDPSNNFSPDG
ncbi:hypothetical protein [Pusillimonas minor]|nr:hypothetical protein [Pusillimonas minor]